MCFASLFEVVLFLFCIFTVVSLLWAYRPRHGTVLTWHSLLMANSYTLLCVSVLLGHYELPTSFTTAVAIVIGTAGLVRYWADR